jgi:hypothetical protein
VKNIIVVGDSFSSNPLGWPTTLATELNLNLICYGVGGQSWWSARNFMTQSAPDTINNAEFIVFAHTNAERIPTLNEQIGKIDHSKKPETEIESAIHLYYKYIHAQDFISWAHQQWFMEISRLWGHKKLCHLHCFPWTVSYSNLLSGVNITTNLTALSLNELAATEFRLVGDDRVNHFNQHNNQQLGVQVAAQLKNYTSQSVELDVDQFDQATRRWLDYGTNWPSN